LTVDLPDLSAVVALGARIAAQLKPGDVVALSGALGAGKTTLARAVIAACGHAGEVPSPSYTILETYPDCEPPLVHADFYRLDDLGELAELGLEDYRRDAALVAEWPEHAGGFANEPGCLSIALEAVGEARRAIVEGGEAWLGRMP
jgi:tRNA threonylcarbamoyladenosine biosynthesis protein TsaE